MKDKDRAILKKIINCINDIESYVNGLTTESFMIDKKTITACAFTASQIRELSKDISNDVQNKYSNIPWRAMKGMRNKIVHDYESIDLSVLWNTIQKNLPELKAEIERIISESPEDIL